MADTEHQFYKAYAVAMGMVYIIGIPAVSFLLLWSNRVPIKQMQRIREALEDAGKMGNAVNADKIKYGDLLSDAEARFSARGMPPKQLLIKLSTAHSDEHPIISGLSPLYRDYGAHFWFFEILQFCQTTILCGLSTLLQGSSRIFLSLVTTQIMLMLLANFKPYVSRSLGVLAQVLRFISRQTSVSIVNFKFFMFSAARFPFSWC
jgi:hypothetical protein